MGDVTPLPLRPAHAVMALPAALRAAPERRADPLDSTGGKRGVYAVGDLARTLQINHLSPRVIIDKLRVLARHDGMPLPRTPRTHRGVPVRGPASIYARSRWDAGEIDAWLDGRGPAAPARPVPVPIREEMKARAGQLAAVA